MKSFTRAAVGSSLVLAVSVGTNIALATIASALWVADSGVSNQDRVVAVFASAGSVGLLRESSASLTAGGISRRLLPSGAFDSVAGQVLTDGENSGLTSRLRLGSGTSVPSVAAVTSSYFEVLGVRVQGRAFTTDDDQATAEATVIVSRDYWQRTLAGDQSVIGTVLNSYPEPVRVIGVVEGNFQGALRGEKIDVWMPQNLAARFARSPLTHVPQNSFPLLTFARLRPGMAIAEAESLVSALRGSRPNEPRVQLVPIGELFGAPGMRAFQIDHRSLGVAIVSTAILVALCGTISLAGLAFAAYERRRHEYAVRVAVGATRAALFQRLAGELGLLMLAGCCIGAAVATLALRGAGLLDLPLGALTARSLQPALKVGPAILGAGVASVTVLLACVPPMLRLLRVDVSRTLAGRGGDAMHLRARAGLLAGTVAGATVLAVMAALFLGSVRTTFSISPGFPAAEVMFIEVLTRTSLAESDEMWSEHARRQQVAAQHLEHQLKGLTGIEAIAFGRPTISRDYQRQLVAPRTIRTEGGDVSVRCVVATVGAGYVEAIGLTVSAGRGFRTVEGSSVAMVSRSLASSLFPDGNPVGQTIWLGSALQVVGVFDDVAFGAMSAGPVNALLVNQSPDRLTQGTSLSWVLRSKMAGPLREQVAEIVQEVFPDAALHSVMTAHDLIGDDIADMRLGAWLFSTYAVASLGVAAIGVWALVASIVDSRRRELGIRLALGLSGRRLQTLLVRAALVPTFVGLALGLFGAVIVQRLLGSWLSGSAVEGPEWYVAGVFAVVAAAAVSALLGSRRALRLSAATDL